MLRQVYKYDQWIIEDTLCHRLKLKALIFVKKESQLLDNLVVRFSYWNFSLAFKFFSIFSLTKRLSKQQNLRKLPFSTEYIKTES